MDKDIKNERQNLKWFEKQSTNEKINFIFNHLEICKIVLNSILDQEVEDLTGERYSRTKPHDGRYSRWGYNEGSVNIGDRRIKIEVPRVYDNNGNKNKSLDNYQKLIQLPGHDEALMKSILYGLSTRDYKEVATKLIDSFGLSSGSISKKFVKRSQLALEEFENRRFDETDFVSIFIDGKELAKEQMVIALGVTNQGVKMPLGVIQTTTENSKSISELLKSLVNRGLKYDRGLLVVIDGSKGIHKAVKEVFGNAAFIQRCQWHKRENVISYLPEKKQDEYKQKIQSAYQKETYKEARQELENIINQLEHENHSAANSLREGLEETLTLHQLDLVKDFRRSFSTTNLIENLNSQLGKYLKKVKRWVNSNQRHRWVVSGLLESEKKMRKVNNYKNLNKMQNVLQTEFRKLKQLNEDVMGKRKQTA